MLERVGERLLGDAVDGQRHARVEVAGLAAWWSARTGRPASRTCSISPSRPGRPGCGSSSPAGSVSVRSTTSSRRISRSATRPVSSIVASASSAATGSRLQRPPGAGGQHAHHADVVGHHVVQLAGDAAALVGHRLFGDDVLVALGGAGAVLQRGDVGPPVVHRAADEERQQEQQRVVGDVVGDRQVDRDRVASPTGRAGVSASTSGASHSSALVPAAYRTVHRGRDRVREHDQRDPAATPVLRPRPRRTGCTSRTPTAQWTAVRRNATATYPTPSHDQRPEPRRRAGTRPAAAPTAPTRRRTAPPASMTSNSSRARGLCRCATMTATLSAPRRRISYATPISPHPSG